MIADELRAIVKKDIHEKLGSVNLWCGPNQRGKSSRLVAVRLGFLGSPGFTNWQELLPPGATDVTSHLYKDGELVAFFEGRPGKVPLHELPGFQELDDNQRKLLIPQVPLRELVDFGPKRGRRAIIQRWGGAGRMLEKPKLSSEESGIWDDKLKDSREKLEEDVPAVEVLAELHRQLSSYRLATSKTLKTLTEEVARQQAELAEQAAGSEQLPTLKKQLELANRWKKSTTQRLRVSELKDEIAALEEEAATLEEELVSATEAWEAVNGAHKEAHGELAEYENKTERGGIWLEAVENALNEKCPGCPLCGSNADLAEVAKFLRSVNKENAEEEQKLTQEVDTRGQEVQKAVEARDISDKLLATKSRYLGRLQAELTGLESGLAALEAPEEWEGAVPEELEKRVNALEKAEAARTLLKSNEARLLELQRKKDCAIKLEEKAKELMDNRMKSLKAGAEKDVQSFMPPSLKVTLDLEKARWRVYGDDGRPHDKSACGFESSSLYPAMIQAHAMVSPIKVAIFDDSDLVGFDRPNLIELMNTMVRLTKEGKLDQVFMAHAWLTPDDCPEGVTTHWLGPKNGATTNPVTRSALGL